MKIRPLFIASIIAAGILSGSNLRANLIASDEGVGSTMDWPNGTIDNLSEFIIGYSGPGIVRDFGADEVRVGLGIWQYNVFTVQNGSSVSSTGGIIGVGEESGATAGGQNIIRVTGAGSTWTNSGSMVVIGGYSQFNQFYIENHASVTSTTAVIGRGLEGYSAQGAYNMAAVRSGTWTISGELTVGYHGRDNSLSIESGGKVSSASLTIGHGNDIGTGGMGSTVYVTGSTSQLSVAGNVFLGKNASGVGVSGQNHLTATDGALITIEGEISFGDMGSLTNNFIVLDGGYIALFGDQLTAVGQMITDGTIKIGSSWIDAEEGTNLLYDYFTTEETASEFAGGHENLSGYTIMKAHPNAVPEPSTYALLALGAGAVLFFRRRN